MKVEGTRRNMIASRSKDTAIVLADPTMPNVQHPMAIR